MPTPPLVKRYSWMELANITEQPGVYAWYYSPELTNFDIEQTIKQLEGAKAGGQIELATGIIKAFLETRVFYYFREEAYKARLSGPLKQIYEGELEHQIEISDTLAARIAETPERLRLIRKILELSAPNFASPLYIGMSGSLRTRLIYHKTLIERYRGFQSTEAMHDQKADESSFAWQVVNRRIPPERLFVVTCPIVGSLENIHLDIENILNRIYYPLLGRN